MLGKEKNNWIYINNTYLSYLLINNYSIKIHLFSQTAHHQRKHMYLFKKKGKNYTIIFIIKKKEKRVQKEEKIWTGWENWEARNQKKKKKRDSTHGKSARNHGPIRRSLWQKVIGDCGWAYQIPSVNLACVYLEKE